nr:MAG TPA: hypothetical protein [Caudoviricetes sp.]
MENPLRLRLFKKSAHDELIGRILYTFRWILNPSYSISQSAHYLNVISMVFFY